MFENSMKGRLLSGKEQEEASNLSIKMSQIAYDQESKRREARRIIDVAAAEFISAALKVSCKKYAPSYLVEARDSYLESFKELEQAQ